MDKIIKNRVATIAVKYNIGIDTLLRALTEKGLITGKVTSSYILTEEQFQYIHELFSENLQVKEKIAEIRYQEITDKLIVLLPNLVEFLNLNVRLKNFYPHTFPWKYSEILESVRKYIDSIPKENLMEIKENNLLPPELLEELESFFNKEGKKNNKIVEKEDDPVSDRDDYFEDGPYCSACQQAPCMCSDRERSSTVFEF